MSLYAIAIWHGDSQSLKEKPFNYSFDKKIMYDNKWYKEIMQIINYVDSF